MNKSVEIAASTMIGAGLAAGCSTRDIAILADGLTLPGATTVPGHLPGSAGRSWGPDDAGGSATVLPARELTPRAGKG